MGVGGVNQAEKMQRYEEVTARINALLGMQGDGRLESDKIDWVAAMATVSCELHQAFEYFHWTGFYRVIDKDLLQVGPYQGGHGCLSISFARGVCGAAARTGKTQLVPDVHSVADHIACSSTTQSEIVVPVLTSEDRLIAVLDVDSDDLAAFDEIDQKYLEHLCRRLGEHFSSKEPFLDHA